MVRVESRFPAVSNVVMMFSLAIASALTAIPRTALAQPCGNPATNVLAESTVCGPLVRISWTNPPGLVFPKVWRSADQNFANATLIYNPGLFGATTTFDSPPTAETNYFYWVGGDIVGCLGQSGVGQVPLTGPLPAGRFTINTYPAAVAVATCSGMRISWQPAWDVTTWNLVRASTSDTGDRDDLGTFIRTVTSFTDTEVLPGSAPIYGVFIASGCGSSGNAGGSGYIRVGPWTSAAARGAAVNVGQHATLNVVNPSAPAEAISAPAPTSFVWTRNGLPLSESAKYTGTTTLALTINNVRLEDAGLYSLLVQYPCGQFPVDAYLAVTQPCRADFNQSGGISVQDIFDFLTAYFAGCP